MARTELLLLLAAVLFALGLVGVVVRRNALVLLMCMELMVNAVVLALVAYAQRGGSIEGGVLIFLVFVVAAAEIAIAIPIVLLLRRQRGTLDVARYSELRG
jgi:NADH-quinone oxidoreductase subunit K